MTTTTVKAPFKADHVGSLLRPASIHKARKDYSEGTITAEELRQIEDQEIKRIVDKQIEVGLQSVTDGEFRRSWWHLDFMWGLEGVEKAATETGLSFHGVETRKETARVVGKIGFSAHPFIEDFNYLQSIVPEGIVARQTIPSAVQFLYEITKPHNIEATKKQYPNKEDLYNDIVKAYKKALQAFYEAGCRNLQMDEVVWAVLCDQDYRQNAAKDKIDLEALVKEYVELNNRILADKPEDLVVTTHVCRGNYRSTWHYSGGYDPVSQELFGNENVDAYYLEFDSERAGGFEPLQYVSGEKKVVLGLITSKRAELENQEEVIARIKEASQYVPLDRLCLSPQCGFSSTEEGNELTEEEQWKKFELIKAISEKVWGK
ncbi:5-methyltetrahydropteroyltriglutamate--homocysteine S-methyltransferase [Pullulanibacillus sp. KACC 23026]|uniref:5-methyltetrahydropteroyltriglutamate-- homocysteine S-methyltransferase n=1 Tax=Pullulanibacillus sp. KACC 23026 TaxID=3028315 RepID=UPI0023AF705C|nr:5-methyltetrahydropteroyltriglutamate--homocysteine S-methyltransferase [Pullulanibacillus sp. KACC 23026]WEG11137.1 5-methyltetrahydropteroyltriglutamate--homocysteine S-methyltransferase [Pullulanibacillus sp. KACC 23026]